MNGKSGVLTIIGFILLSAKCVMSLEWEYALTSEGSIKFFDTNWKYIGTNSHVFGTTFTSMDFDESEDEIYFGQVSEGKNPMLQLYALKVQMDDSGSVSNQMLREVLQTNASSSIKGVAYDPVEQFIYWTDIIGSKIFHANVSDPTSAKVLFDFTAEKGEPKSIAIDICRRKLYWTNTNHKNPSIERASLDGTEHEVLFTTDLFLPNGIHVDQFTGRLYWVDKKEADHFAVESSFLNGTDRQELYRGMDNNPIDVAVGREGVFWVDYNSESVFRVSKESAHILPFKMYNPEHMRPRAIILRTDFLSSQENNTECKAAITKINAYLTDADPNKVHRDVTDLTVSKKCSMLEMGARFNSSCLNRGTFNAKLNKCICGQGFQGKYCETHVCHNYCIQGECRMSSEFGYPQCICYAGFEGTRCERDVCLGQCLNDGRCDFENGEPVCHCVGPHTGRHCELIDKEKMCQTYCNPNAVFGTLPEMCESCSPNNDNETEDVGSPLTNFQDAVNKASTCIQSSFSPRYIIAISAVIGVCLFLVIVILYLIQRKHKPLRPRIKKTYVVRKNVTPLTCRPSAANDTTEHCEITIEDCCNMNICDTPCFDPHAMQESSNGKNGSNRRKEDKSNLLDNMDGDLY